MTMARVPREPRFIVELTIHKSRLGDNGKFRLERTPQCTFLPVATPDVAEDDEGTAADKAKVEVEAKVEAMAERILAALVKANANGVRITNQEVLRALVKGDNGIKSRAVAALLGSGRVEGGRGRPFAPRLPEPAEGAE